MARQVVRGIPEAVANLKKYQIIKTQAIKDRLKKQAFKIELAAKEMAPVQYGRLRASITTNWAGSPMDKANIKSPCRAIENPSKPEDAVGRPDGAKDLVLVVGTNVHYGCIFNAHTSIKLNKGMKTIGQMKEKDVVIGQDGLEHDVVKIYKFPTIKKPNLIKITTGWRKDKKHILTVTEDHKILVFKDNIAFWIQAKNLKKGYKVFSPKKIPINKGTAKKKYCLNCKQVYMGTNRKYCSMDCKNKHWNEKGNNPHIGMKRSNKAKKNMKIANRERLRKHPEIHPNRILAQKGYKTNCEKQVEFWLKENKFEYKTQFKVNGHFVDFAIPSKKLIFEADGAFWHQNQKKDIERDKEILKELKGWKIVHLHFTDKRFSKNINPNPIENVYYLQCNNSLNSYVNLNYFRFTPILKIEKFNYNDISLKKHGTKKNSYLYDLSIEGVHSFIANGILVSNSAQEHGTSKIPARPYIYPAYFMYEGETIRAIAVIMKKDVKL